jgi:hypothetical protein
MNRFFPSALLILFSSSACLAAPSVSGLSGSVASDQNVVITGTGFGTAGQKQYWFGGATGLVDSLASGARIDQQNILGLSLLTPSTATYPHVSTERSWSNGKSLVFDVRNTTEYKQTLFFDMGASGYTTLYTNALIYLNHDTLASGSYLQWKMMRWTKTQTVVDGDGAYMSNRPNTTSFFTYFNAPAAYWFEGSYRNLPGRGGWYRYETWIQLNSAGASDGSFRVKVTNPTSGAVVVDNDIRNIPFNQSSNLRWLVLQNYFGNAGDSGSGQRDNANAVAWWDDIFISTSQARVEVCAEATWAACVNREVQPVSSWSDNSISLKINRGALANLGNAYVYVTNSRGEVNTQGFKLVAGNVPKPNPATGVATQ